MSLKQSIRQRILVGGFVILSVVLIVAMFLYIPINADTMSGTATSNESYKQQVLT